jgi:anti-sigma factor RsiW
LQTICPEKEMLAAYVEDGLTSEERNAIELHLAECRNCRELLALIVRTKAIITQDLGEP